MGNYATTTSFFEVLVGYFKGATTTADTLGSAVVSRHIDNAEAVVNSYVAARYSLPLATVPPLLRTWSEQIAAYETIKSATWMDPKQKNAYLEEFKHAFQQLKMLADGTLKLTYTDGSIVPTASSGRFLSSSDGYTPIFGKDDPESWERDDDEVADSESARS